MKAAVLEKPKVLVIKDIHMPKYSDNEVLIKIKTVGLCGSDIHYYNEGRIGNQIVKKPIILGHESAGIVEKVGNNVRELKVGDRVTVEPGVPCGRCDYCKTGKYNLCKDIIFMATPPVNGAFTEYIKYSQNYVYKIPDNVSFTEAALMEPLSVGYNALTSSQIKPGDSVVILGAGPIGLACLEVSKIKGASRIFISDINDYRLNMAKKHGAFATINVEKDNLIDIIKKNTSNEGADCIIEASGFEESIIKSLEVVKKGGKIVLVGIEKDKVIIPLIKVIHNNIIIEGLRRYSNTYKPLIKLLESRMVDYESCVSHRFKLDEVNKAFNVANDPDIDKMKIMIDM